jgi:hypothetical protein
VLFETPHAIDVRATVEVATPASWRDALQGQENVAVLPLCDGKGPKSSGWCVAASQLRGAEIEWMCGGINSKQPTHGGLWRQGNLLHFGFEPSPSEYNETGRKLLLNSIAYISRFTTDRPIVRSQSFVDSAPMRASKHWLEFMLTFPKAKVEDLAGWFLAPWGEQIGKLEMAEARAFVNERLPALCIEGSKFTFDQDALQLGVDVQKDGVVRQLADMLHGEQAERARALLGRLVADGPGADTTANNWDNWLKGRADALCFDWHTHVWRLDPLAFWRGSKSADLRGPARADGDARRDPAAAELAAKVVAAHGGARALEDLETFTCRFGEIRCCWDKQRGLFRLENTGTIPAGNRATPWRVVVFDTAADVDLVRGGGPEPRPFVSGRGYYRELQERLFLPLRLLEPGTSVRLLPDADGCRCREVRLAGRCADLRKVHVLHVDPQTGALRAIDVIAHEGGKATTFTIEGQIEVGPLRLPGKFARKTAAGSTIVEYVDAAWNPKLPDGVDSSKEMLLGSK